MTKADITARIYAQIGISKKESAELVDTIFDILKSTLVQGEEIKVSGFGKFEVRKKLDRKGRNPQTGQEITITARRVVTFMPSALLRQAINNG